MKRDYQSFGEEQLVRRAIGGDRDAFDEIYRRTQGVVYGFVIKMVRNQDLANEIVQNSYITFYRKLKTPDIKIESIKGFICGIARKEFLVRMRKRGSEVSIDDAQLPEEFVVNSTEKLEREQLSKKVQEVVDKLPDEYKELLILWIYEECKEEEIAEVLNTPVGTVKTRKRKVKEILRGWLSPLLDMF